MSKSAVRAGLKRIAGVFPHASSCARRIAFIHIPKCAGSSVDQTLRRTYLTRSQQLYGRLLTRSAYQSVVIDAAASVAAARTLDTNLQKVRLALLSYELSLGSRAYICGHVPFTRDIGRYFGDRWHFVTVLRDPVERFFSEYFYNRFKRSAHFRVNEDIHSYLETPDARRTSAQLINFLTGRADVYAEAGSSDVDLAVDNLKFFAAVGFVENMERLAADLQQCFGKRPKFPVLNKTPATADARSSQRDSEIRNKVVRMCAADIEVYRRAWALHQQGALACGPVRAVTPLPAAEGVQTRTL